MCKVTSRTKSLQDQIVPYKYTLKKNLDISMKARVSFHLNFHCKKKKWYLLDYGIFSTYLRAFFFWFKHIVKMEER